MRKLILQALNKGSGLRSYTLRLYNPRAGRRCRCHHRFGWGLPFRYALGYPCIAMDIPTNENFVGKGGGPAPIRPSKNKHWLLWKATLMARKVRTKCAQLFCPYSLRCWSRGKIGNSILAIPGLLETSPRDRILLNWSRVPRSWSRIPPA